MTSTSADDLPSRVYGQPGSIGAISARIGCDVRELIVAGYSDRQVWRVLRGEITLEQLFAETPENRPLF